MNIALILLSLVACRAGGGDLEQTTYRPACDGCHEPTTTSDPGDSADTAEPGDSGDTGSED